MSTTRLCENYYRVLRQNWAQDTVDAEAAVQFCQVFSLHQNAVHWLSLLWQIGFTKHFTNIDVDSS